MNECDKCVFYDECLSHEMTVCYGFIALHQCSCMFTDMTEAECIAFLSSGEQEEPEQYELKEVQK